MRKKQKTATFVLQFQRYCGPEHRELPPETVSPRVGLAGQVALIVAKPFASRPACWSTAAAAAAAAAAPSALHSSAHFVLKSTTRLRVQR